MANRFWVGGTATWDATAGTKWSTTSGGGGGSAVPAAADDVFFDGNSGAVTVTLSGSRTCNNLNFTGFTGTFAAGTGAITVSGTTCKFVGGMSYSGTVSLSFTNTGAVALTNAGFALGTVTMNSAMTSTGSLTLTENLPANTLSIDAGTFSAGTFNVTLGGNLQSAGAVTRVINMGSGTWTFSGSNASILISGTNLTWNKNTANAEFTNGAPTQRAISNAQTIAFNTLTLAQTTIPHNFTIGSGGTTTIDSFVCNAAGTLPAFLFNTANSTLVLPNGFHENWFNGRGLTFIATAATGNISIASGTRTFDKIGAYNISFAGGATFIANNSVDLGNNTGMTFTKPHITARQQLGM